jgi:transposase
MKSVEEKEHFVRLRGQGLSFDKIEERLGISKKTLITWERELNEDVQKERAKEIEDVREAY